jgi:hypothetical protein
MERATALEEDNFLSLLDVLLQTEPALTLSTPLRAAAGPTLEVSLQRWKHLTDQLGIEIEGAGTTLA